MKKQPDKGKITALYERLSHDDERAGESVSIENQKRILEDYAQKNGFTNIRHFTDDGVRGTTFKRPGPDAMQEENRVFEKVDMMGFMLFMSEMVRWAKSHDIPIGFNRGSCGGSRVAYVTDIIDLKPEQSHTVISRFCNNDRKEICDSDIDVAPDDRDKIYQYIINRFGSNKTAYILAIGTISEKGTIDEIGRALANIWEKDNLIDEKTIRRKIKEAKAAGEDPSSLETELAKAKEHNAKRSKQNPYALGKIAEIKKEYAVNPNKAKKDHADVFYYFDGLLNTPISQSMHPAGILASPITLYDN